MTQSHAFQRQLRQQLHPPICKSNHRGAKPLGKLDRLSPTNLIPYLSLPDLKFAFFGVNAGGPTMS
jgi:hypothetical protein